MFYYYSNDIHTTINTNIHLIKEKKKLKTKI